MLILGGGGNGNSSRIAEWGGDWGVLEAAWDVRYIVVKAGLIKSSLNLLFFEWLLGPK